jgi:Uma2 family endonuclease
MSTITETEPLAQTPDVGWIPSPGSLYRLSLEQYEAMVASGVFAKRDRFHLINGFLVAKMTEYPPHSAASGATRLVIESVLPVGWYVRPDKPLRIPNYASVPEPDLVIARGSCWDYQARHPEPANVALVAEVANSSLLEDRAMAEIYGKGGRSGLLDRQPDRPPGRGSHRSRPGRLWGSPDFQDRPGSPGHH